MQTKQRLCSTSLFNIGSVNLSKNKTLITHTFDAISFTDSTLSESEFLILPSLVSFKNDISYTKTGYYYFYDKLTSSSLLFNCYNANRRLVFCIINVKLSSNNTECFTQLITHFRDYLFCYAKFMDCCIDYNTFSKELFNQIRGDVFTSQSKPDRFVNRNIFYLFQC